MTVSTRARRTMAEIDFGGGQTACVRIGRHTIHQFWYLFSSHFRGVLLPPQRRPDTGRVAWSWTEPPEGIPPTPSELAEVRRRLGLASKLSGGALADPGAGDEASEAGRLERQVRQSVTQMVARLIALSDPALAGFVGRTEAGLMLHSWGADAPATPTYPDAPKPCVSGMVWVDDRPAGGLTVGLENPAGVVVVNTRSGPDGGFAFKSVAPGAYRLRVTGREDFPAEGRAVDVVQEAVTGLILRNRAASRPVDSPLPGASPATRSSGWPAGLRAGLGLIAVGTLGFAAWHYLGRAPEPSSQPGLAGSSWQAAHGDLQSWTETSGTADSQKVGADGKWTKLSALRTPAKTLGQPHPRPPARPTGSRDQATPRTSEPEGDEGTTALESTAGKSETASGPHLGQNPNPIAAEIAESTDPRATKADRVASTADLGRTVTAGAPAMPEKHDPAGLSDPAAKARRSQPGGGGVTVERESREPEDTGAVTESRPEAASAPPPAGSVHSSNMSTASASAATISSMDGSSGADPASLSGGVAAVAPDSIPESTHHLAPRKGATRPERTGAIRSLSATAPSEGTGLSAGAAEGDSDTGIRSADAGSTAVEASVSPPAAAAVREPAPASSTARSEQPASETAELGPEAPAIVKMSNKKAGRTRGEDAPAPADPSRSVNSGAPVPSSELTNRDTWRISAWAPRLVQDVIVPTTPQPAGREESAVTLRQNSLQEQQARMPDLFRSPVTMSGLIIEFSTNETGSGDEPRWRDDGKATSTGASVQDNRAELAWPGPNPPRDMHFILGWPDGRIIAEVGTDQKGALKLCTAPAAGVWIWVGIGPSVDASSTVPPPPLEWRLRPDRPLPTTWRHDERWAGGHGRRIEIPLAAAASQPPRWGLALVDHSAGWALTSEVTAP